MPHEPKEATMTAKISEYTGGAYAEVDDVVKDEVARLVDPHLVFQPNASTPGHLCSRGHVYLNGSEVCACGEQKKHATHTCSCGDVHWLPRG